jgi:hypothetical protein
LPALQLRGARRVHPRIAACIWKEVHDEEAEEGRKKTAQEKGQVSIVLGILGALAAAPSAPFFFSPAAEKPKSSSFRNARAPGNLSR